MAAHAGVSERETSRRGGRWDGGERWGLGTVNSVISVDLVHLRACGLRGWQHPSTELMSSAASLGPDHVPLLLGKLKDLVEVSRKTLQNVQLNSSSLQRVHIQKKQRGRQQGAAGSYSTLSTLYIRFPATSSSPVGFSNLEKATVTEDGKHVITAARMRDDVVEAIKAAGGRASVAHLSVSGLKWSLLDSCRLCSLIRRAAEARRA